jgi:hypothetical protein
LRELIEEVFNVKKRILILGVLLALIAILAMPMAAFASNTGTQNASTFAGTITIVGKTAASTAAVSTITFPAGLPDAIISNPSSDATGTGENTPQVVGSSSEPVVQLYNTSAGTLNVWLDITSWTGGAVVAENYKLVPTTTITVAAVDSVLSSDGTANTVDTTVSMDTLTYKALYLKATLGATAGLSGTSTLTILGES